MRHIVCYIWPICYDLDDFFKVPTSGTFLKWQERGTTGYSYAEGVPWKEDRENGVKKAVVEDVAKQMTQAGIVGEKETEK